MIVGRGGLATNRGQAAKKERHVDVDLGQQWPEIGDEWIVARGCVHADLQSNAQLVGHHPAVARLEAIDVGIKSRLERFGIAHHGHERVGKLQQVPVADLRLGDEPVAAALGVGGVGRPVGIDVFEPPIRAVVDRQSQNRHVVGVHHAMHEPHPHPVDDHRGGPLADLVEHRSNRLGRRRTRLRDQMGKVASHGEIDEASQFVDLLPRREDLEVAKPRERRRHAADNRAGLRSGVAIIEHVADHVLAGGDDAQGAGGGHAEMVHRLAAEKLADR